MLEAIRKKFCKIEKPGENAHLEVTPYRKKVSQFLNHTNAPRLCGVSILLFEKKQETNCILIQRPVYKGTHSAQIAFPGGKQEQNETLLDTALRETEEEIGISSNQIDILGALTELYIPPSNFLVTPFLGILKNEPIYTLDKREVDHVFSFPIQKLIDIESLPITKVKLSNGLSLETPYFDIENKIVWGATAAMLNEFRHILIRIKNS